MKNKFIKIRVSDSDRARFMALAESRGKDLSEIIRDHLERLIKRAEKSRGAAE